MHNKIALVVDDSRVARMTLGKLLKAQEFEVIEQVSAEAALEWLQTSADAPDIIFLDVTMGGMDGLTACREIKTQQAMATIPVVICTGNDSEAGLENALASGAVAVLSKPPATDALQTLLDDVVVTSPAVAAETTPVTEKDTADINAIVATLHEKLMPELQQQLQTIAAEISRDVAKQTAQEASNKHGLSLVPEITRQVTESAQQQLSEAQQRVSSQADEHVAKAAEQAIEKALQGYGLTEKVMVTLRSEGMDWLNKQQAPVRDALVKQLQQDLEPIVSRCLEQQLHERVLPLIQIQLADTQQNVENRQQETITQLQAQLKQQRFMVIGVGILAALAVVITLF